MATLVLTAVGTAIAGPAGAALGSIVGQAIDTQLFGPGPRRGPRLDDLRLQTSSYGTQIPRIYGRMRVAGTVIWATDLKEEEEIEGGGKGSPETVRYNYSCSFAVALSSRPISRIGRIWADGKLIRGGAGDLKVGGKFRATDGRNGQAADPLIASIEGQGATPAYNGLAVAIFEDLPLAEFGNRIPVLTFEVVADRHPVSASAILADMGAPTTLEATGDDEEIVGFAAMGSDRRSAMEGLAELTACELRTSGDRIEVVRMPAPRLIAPGEPNGWKSDGTKRSNRRWRQESASTVPAAVGIRYHEPTRDYQAGLARATIEGGRGEHTLDSAAALSGASAKQLASRALARRWAGRDRMTLELSTDWIDLAPGDVIDVPGHNGLWVVEETMLEGFAVRAECRRIPGASRALEADPGRSNTEPDTPIGATKLSVIDLPTLANSSDGRLELFVAASSSGAFKSVPVTTQIGGASGPNVVIGRKARCGTALGALPAGVASCIDRTSQIDVSLHDPAQVLLHADADALDQGANAAMLGDEVVQFGRAEWIAPGRYRISHLLRGRRGTEWAMHDHADGEPFTMIDLGALTPVPLDATQLGLELRATAWGIADDPENPPSATHIAAGAAMAPLAPCRLRAKPLPESDLHIEWVPRSKARWAWIDEQSDAAIRPSFIVKLSSATGSVERLADGTSIIFPVGELRSLGSEILISIAEIGVWRHSPPAYLHVDLKG